MTYSIPSSYNSPRKFTPSAIVGENGITSLLLQYSFHFDIVPSYCFRVPDLQDASMISVTVDEKPLFWSCFRISGTSVGIVSGEVCVFRLGDWQI